ncbi:Isoeugenol synthase 1 [Frankliniella fusca]|uniref:Isoeugenol synthase 1 n=1 Tax=Frankliniella fusca TaxID=407009 RepID=A0AAE1HCL2_9NEOP|nr:Isoeugenol synthase 1 [Frankliniella fusca]
MIWYCKLNLSPCLHFTVLFFSFYYALKSVPCLLLCFLMSFVGLLQSVVLSISLLVTEWKPFTFILTTPISAYFIFYFYHPVLRPKLIF